MSVFKLLVFYSLSVQAEVSLIDSKDNGVWLSAPSCESIQKEVQILKKWNEDLGQKMSCNLDQLSIKNSRSYKANVI